MKLKYIIAHCILATAFCGIAQGQLSATEDLIRNEILRLGGDWEGETEPRLVQLIGPNFHTEHFEFLTHLPSLRTVCIYDVHLTLEAMACIAQIQGLEQLEINSCQVDGACFSLLKANRRLSTLMIENVSLSASMAIEISQLSSLRKAYFDYCIVEPSFDEAVLAMEFLEDCHAIIVENNHSPETRDYSRGNISISFVSKSEFEEYRKLAAANKPVRTNDE